MSTYAKWLWLIIPLALLTDVKVQLSRSEITVVGTSTLHDWTATSKEARGTGIFVLEEGQLKDIKSLNISLAVKSLKSDKGATMDKNMYRALHAAEHPEITFTLTRVERIEPDNGGWRVKVRGNMHINGTTRTISIEGKGIQRQDQFEFSGAFALRMTDYGIEPPTLFMGALETGDKVTIQYKVYFHL